LIIASLSKSLPYFIVCAFTSYKISFVFSSSPFIDLVEKLYQNNVDAIYIKEFEDIAQHIRDNVDDNDLVITCGAGPIFKVAEMLVK